MITEPTVSRVYSAALAAAADDTAAEQATLRVCAAAASARPDPDPDRLVATAVRLALRAAPAAPFAAMTLPDAEAVALTRLAGLDETGVATLLGVPALEVRRRLKRGLLAALPRAVSA